ncbi:hypothetical protein [Spirosoma arcticum]
MSEFEQNIPDDFWRKAFEEAAETPPPRVWDAVERRLDEGEGPKILPLWGAGLVSSPLVGWSVGVAAAVALLLVGWWALRTTTPGNPVTIASQQPSKQPVRALSLIDRNAKVASQQPAKQTGRVSVIQTPKPTDCWPSFKSIPKRPSSPAEQAQETVALTQKPVSATGNHSLLTSDQPMNRPAAKAFTQPSEALAAKTPEPVDEQQISNAQPTGIAQRANVSNTRETVVSVDRVAFTGVTAAPTAPANGFVPESDRATASAQPTANRQSLSFDQIPTSPLRLREVGSIQRIVWLRPAEPATEPTATQPKRQLREVWASVSLMPGAFDPAVDLRSAQPSFAQSNALTNTSTSQPSINSRANFSVAYQAGAGIQLTERWSIESGVGYLAGRSVVDSPVQNSVAGIKSGSVNRTGQASNLYVDALRNSSSSVPSANNNQTASFDYAFASNQFNALNTYNPQTRQSLNNDYQYVQVPVQVGYQLRPRKRLSLALLGGFLSNIFVRNTVGDNLVITGRDGVYRPLSWAANLGARFRYRPSRQWSASLAGVYQPSLGPGTRPESTVQTRPTSAGMSFGIDYHF